MKKWKKEIFDPLNNRWLLKKRWLLFFWLPVSVGSEEEVDAAIKRLNDEE